MGPDIIVGLVASIIQIVGVLKTAYRAANYGFRVVQKLDRVLQRVRPLQRLLEEDPHRARCPPEVLADVIDPCLRAVKETLKSIPQPPSPGQNAHVARHPVLSTIWYGIRHGRTASSRLDDVLEQLASLLDRVNITSLLLTETPPITGVPEDCPISIGLDRVAQVVNFIKSPSPPSSQPTTSAAAANTLGLCIVGVVGQGGLGKHTLLVHILNEVQQSFDIIAHVKLVGESPESRALGKVQSTLLWQLGGPRRRFQGAVNEGRMELLDRLKELQELGKSVCIAIMNVWRAEDLEDLLPQSLATHLVTLNMCIIIATRVKSIVGRLTCHCGGDPRVLSFEPELLQVSSSRGLLSAHANLPISNPVTPGDEQSIDPIVPFCGGLPLALTLAGALFGRERRPQFWEDWMRKMAPEAAGIPLRNIDRVLELSFKHLQHQSKEALLDIGACLSYLQHWDTVESIVGSTSMDDLQDLSLIDVVVIRGRHTHERVLRMHGLIRKLVALKHDIRGIVKWDPETWSTSLLSNERFQGIVKFLRLVVQNAEGLEMKDGEMYLRMDGSCFALMQNLKVLEISGSFECTQLLLPTSLRVMKLERNKYLTEIIVKPCLQRLELRECVALTELPTSIYECKDLRYLCIVGSPNLGDFRSYSKWTRLSVLWLEKCANITNLPQDLRRLNHLTLVDCEKLQQIPMLYCKLESQQVYIQGCPCTWPPTPSSNLSLQPPSQTIPVGNATASSITTRSTSSKLTKVSFRCMTELESLPLEELRTLKNVTICNGQDVRALWQILVKMVSLERLRLKDCLWVDLEEFPEAVHNLTKLKMEFNHQISKLPFLSLHKLSSLLVLGLNGCTSLQKLPEEIRSLTRLETLKLQGCDSLVKLPNGMCGLSSLKELHLTGCSRLKELPGQIHNMTSLTTLRLERCTSLLKLPDNLCKLESLRLLNMSGCSALVELPEDMGNLRNLRKLSLSYCHKLQKLPSSLCRWAHLFSELDLGGCDDKLEIPSKLREVTCLRM